ncbi:uncharacterized [Tachysurus ichikawai]
MKEKTLTQIVTRKVEERLVTIIHHGSVDSPGGRGSASVRQSYPPFSIHSSVEIGSDSITNLDTEVSPKSHVSTFHSLLRAEHEEEASSSCLMNDQ